MEKGPITKTWLEARKYISENRLEEAEQVLDKGILMLSHLTCSGHGDKWKCGKNASGLLLKNTFGQHFLTMKKTGKCKWVDLQLELNVKCTKA